MPARVWTSRDCSVRAVRGVHDPVRPLGPVEEVGDVFAFHDAAGIELRVMNSLWPFWRDVVDSTLGYSGIRLANARPTPIQVNFEL
jgi:hypothetical protein